MPVNYKKFVFHCAHHGIESSFSYLHRENYADRTYVMRRCDTCDGIMFFIYKEKVDKISTSKGGRRSYVHVVPSAETPPEVIILQRYKLIDYYPKRSYKPHAAIHKDVANDYVEALRCFDNNAFKGCVAMARRALQTTCKLKGAKKPKLEDQIDEIMPEDMKKLAHEIRLWGNLGAHPDELIKNVIEQDAKDILNLAQMLFQYVFIMPYDVEQKMKERNKRKGSKP